MAFRPLIFLAAKPLRIASLLLFFFLSVGCSDPMGEKIDALQGIVNNDLTQLTEKLDSGQIRNATMLNQYADILTKQRPELGQLLSQLARDGSSDGVMFNGLKERVRAAKQATNFVSKEEQLHELENLHQALNPILFNDALSDPLNVMADMSKGSLARVNAVSQNQQTTGEDFGAGSQLVGNPSYGSWSNSGGSSFWQWYGMYAMFSNLTNPIGYDRWGRNRRYSYHNDYGRYRYSSPKQRKAQTDTWNKTKKSYSTGSRYKSPYSTSRTGSSGLSRQSSQAQTAAVSAASRQSKFSQQRKNNSSFRNSRSSTSRGVSRGK